MITISVVVLNYNYARYLPTAVASALGQTHSPLEVIVVDDASTDDSRSVIDGFGDTVGAVLHESNLGQAAAVNSGAAKACGDVIWFLDADDALLPEACASAAAAFAADRRTAKFHSTMAVIDADGRWDGRIWPADPGRLAVGDMSEHVLKYRAHGWPPMSGNAYSADALSKVLPVPAEQYRQAADSFLNEQVAVCGPIARSERPMAAYRLHGANQFAGRPISLDWLRTKIDRELCSHEQLGLLAEQLALDGYHQNPDAVADVAFLGYRLASLRCDPAGHPQIDPSRPDSRSHLVLGGISAAWGNPELANADRLMRTAWFPIIAMAPRFAVPQLIEWYMPDGPSRPIWHRLKRRKTKPAADGTVLVPPAGPDLKAVEDTKMGETETSPTPSTNGSAAPEGQDPEVTIVVTPRERFGLSRASLESIYANTTVDFRLIYVDGNAPRRVADYLRRASVEHGFELLSSPDYLSPNQARNMGMAKVDTPYTVFVDNDLIVTEGWLRHLLDCAEQTGAPVVGPLYFEGDPGQHVVHMAGGDYSLEGDHGSRRFSTVHRFQGQRLDELDADIVREPVDFVEFHCMLIDSAFLRKLGGLDEGLLSTREHLDLCLATAQAGESVYIEPRSQVTYLTPPPVDVGDIPFFLRRWSEAWNQASLEHFCSKHGIAATYSDRLVGMRARRQLLLEPVRRTSARVLPNAADKFLMRVMARLEREANRAVFRVPADSR